MDFFSSDIGGGLVLEVSECHDPLLSQGFLKTQDHSVRWGDLASRLDLKSFCKAWLKSLPPPRLPGIPTNKRGPRAPAAPNAHLSPTAVLLFTSLSPFQLDHEFLRDGIILYTILYSQGLTWSDT